MRRFAMPDLGLRKSCRVLTYLNVHFKQLSEARRTRQDSYEVVQNENSDTGVWFWRWRFSSLNLHSAQSGVKTGQRALQCQTVFLGSRRERKQWYRYSVLLFWILLFEISRNLNCIVDSWARFAMSDHIYTKSCRPKTLVQMFYFIVLDSIVWIFTQYNLHSDQLSDGCRAREDSYEVV